MRRFEVDLPRCSWCREAVTAAVKRLVDASHAATSDDREALPAALPTEEREERTMGATLKPFRVPLCALWALLERDWAAVCRQLAALGPRVRRDDRATDEAVVRWEGRLEALIRARCRLQDGNAAGAVAECGWWRSDLAPRREAVAPAREAPAPAQGTLSDEEAA